MTQAARLRELLRRDGMVVAPGAYDCITARLVARAGFDAVYMTGAGTAATLGYPDFGLVDPASRSRRGRAHGLQAGDCAGPSDPERHRRLREDAGRTRRRHPEPVREMGMREIFALSGADEWDALRTRFRG